MHRTFIFGKSRALSACLCAVALFLGACEEKEKILAGKRFSVNADLVSVSQSFEAEDAQTPPPNPRDFAERHDREGEAPLTIAPQVRNQNWRRRGGEGKQRSQNLALGDKIAPIWQISIGKGDSRRRRINSAPIIGDNRIFTMDTELEVKAHTLSGDPLWSSSLLPAGADGKTALSAGTLSYGAKKIFATTGFGELIALSADDGAILWRQKLKGLALGSATLSEENTVYISASGGLGWAINAENGRIIWSQQGNKTTHASLSTGGATLIDRLILFPYGGGQIIAALKNSGIVVWQSAVPHKRLGHAFTVAPSFITADPLFDGDRLYVGSNTGGLVAFKALNGKQIWALKEGLLDNIWHHNGALFTISDLSQLMRIDAKSGKIVWAKSLTRFTNERLNLRKKIFAHYGPVMAGGKIWIGSEDTGLNAYDPENGTRLETYEIAGGAASAPVVVDEHLYILSKKGILHAFR